MGRVEGLGFKGILSFVVTKKPMACCGIVEFEIFELKLPYNNVVLM